MRADACWGWEERTVHAGETSGVWGLWGRQRVPERQFVLQVGHDPCADETPVVCMWPVCDRVRVTGEEVFCL